MPTVCALVRSSAAATCSVATDGDKVGKTVGETDGAEGEPVGTKVGSDEGAEVGKPVGENDCADKTDGDDV